MNGSAVGNFGNFRLPEKSFSTSPAPSLTNNVLSTCHTKGQSPLITISERGGSGESDGDAASTNERHFVRRRIVTREKLTRGSSHFTEEQKADSLLPRPPSFGLATWYSKASEGVLMEGQWQSCGDESPTPLHCHSPRRLSPSPPLVSARDGEREGDPFTAGQVLLTLVSDPPFAGPLFPR
jgi:hypothetical protein